LDTRLKYTMVTDARLQRRLTAEEFKAFINLMVWTVSLVSDGAFIADDAEMIMDTAHLPRLIEVGVVECDDEGNHRIHPDYWSWQTSKADLKRQDEKRTKDRERKADWRKREQREAEQDSDREPEPPSYGQVWDAAADAKFVAELQQHGRLAHSR
jgi:hypothetical protein